MVAAAAALLAYPLARYASTDVMLAVAAGGILSTLNAVLGFFAIEYGFDKSYTTFLKAVVGGMGIRLLLMLGAMLVLILVARMDTAALTVSMLGFYLVYLVLEILWIQNRVMVKNRN